MAERIVNIPGQKPHVIQIEHGQTKLPKHPTVGPNQIDSTYREDDSKTGQAARREAEREAQLARRSHAPSMIDRNVVANPAEETKIGPLTLRRNPLYGTAEGAFTIGGVDRFQVLDAEGEPLTASAALGAIYEVLIAQPAADKKAYLEAQARRVELRQKAKEEAK